MAYRPTYEAMVAFTGARTPETPDELWLCEHPPVFTQGLAGQASHLLAPGDTEVVQGALEGANLSPIENLVALIDTMRGFEAYMRAAERLDQVTGRAISDVGRV